MGQSVSKKKLQQVEDQLKQMSSIQKQILDMQQTAKSHKSDNVKEELEILETQSKLDYEKARKTINEYEFQLKAEDLAIVKQEGIFRDKFRNNNDVQKALEKRLIKLRTSIITLNELIDLWNETSVEKQKDMSGKCLSELKTAYKTYEYRYNKYMETTIYNYHDK